MTKHAGVCQNTPNCYISRFYLSIDCAYKDTAQMPRLQFAIFRFVSFSLLFFITTIFSHAAPNQEHLTKLADNLIDTGIKYNQIPAINAARYVTVSDASLTMDNTDDVFLVHLTGGVKIFPRKIMVWHEALNDMINGTPFCLTYSPLAGSVAGYRAEVGGRPSALGVTGMMLNGNSVLYDALSGSLWPQLYGIAIDGPRKGTSLERIPVLWTTWELAKKKYPNAMVLSSSTGFRRSYGKDPYGSYLRQGTYYTNQTISYPVMHQDNRLPPKTRIVGITLDGLSVALPRQRIRRDGAVNFIIGTTPMVAFWDHTLHAVRVYARIVNGKRLTFLNVDGKVADTASHSEWSFDGEALFGILRGSVLENVPAINSMWFSWVAYYPNTQIIPEH